jgi:hypothetical protein
MAGCCKEGNESSSSIKIRKFTDQFLETDSGIWSIWYLAAGRQNTLCWFLHITFYYLESCLYFLLALYEAYIFYFSTQPSILTTAIKGPEIKPNFLCAEDSNIIFSS